MADEHFPHLGGSCTSIPIAISLILVAERTFGATVHNADTTRSADDNYANCALNVGPLVPSAVS